jgi:hypothetical protein
MCSGYAAKNPAPLQFIRWNLRDAGIACGADLPGFSNYSFREKNEKSDFYSLLSANSTSRLDEAGLGRSRSACNPQSSTASPVGILNPQFLHSFREKDEKRYFNSHSSPGLRSHSILNPQSSIINPTIRSAKMTKNVIKIRLPPVSLFPPHLGTSRPVSFPHP